LVHADGDLLPALVVDRYGDYRRPILNQATDHLFATVMLRRRLSPRPSSPARVSPQTRRPAIRDDPYGELPAAVEVHMNGLTMLADLTGGQKTGIYLTSAKLPAAQRHARGRPRRFNPPAALRCIARACESVEGVDQASMRSESARANGRQIS
jgi:23S rRNA (cytosine1962-C5)-methyltransferase